MNTKTKIKKAFELITEIELTLRNFSEIIHYVDMLQCNAIDGEVIFLVQKHYHSIISNVDHDTELKALKRMLSNIY